MKTDVSTAIDELQCQFGNAALTLREDGQGGAFVVMEPVSLGTRYHPDATWMGFHIPAQYPYADIYPVFVGDEVKRVDKTPFRAPVTPNHKFEGRSALQVSRRNSSAQAGLQRVTAKVLKILDFLGTMK